MRQLPIPALSVALLCAACSGSKKLMPAEALHMDEATTQAYPSRFYDDQTHIRYDFRDDDKNLYVILETDNASSKMRILREGVKVYFSPSGSKDATRYIQYPYNDMAHNSDHPMRPRQLDTPPDRPVSGEMKNRDHNDISFHKQAALENNGHLQVLDMNNSSPFQFTATTDASGFFRYIAAIPRNALTVTKNNTVIGISIAEMKRTSGAYEGRMAAQTHVNAGGGGMRGGGMGRGMHGGGRGGGMHNREPQDTNGKYSPADPGGKVNWWYRVALTR